MPPSARTRQNNQVSEAMLAGAVVEAVQTLRAPTPATVLAKQLIGPFKRTAKALEPVLESLAAEGRLIRLPARSAKKKPAYSTRPVEDLARLAVVDVLSGPDAPLSLAKLRSHKALKPVTEYLPDPALREIVEGLVAQRRIYVHPKCTATGKIQAKPADLSYGATPARPDRFIEPGLKAIRKQLTDLSASLKPFGVDADAIRRALVERVVQELGEDGVNRGPAGLARPASASASPVIGIEELASQIQERMAELNPAVRTGAMVRLDRLRSACVDLVAAKAPFDEAIRWLATLQRVALHRHDDPHGLGPSERDALVPDDHGGLFNAISWRAPAP